MRSKYLKKKSPRELQSATTVAKSVCQQSRKEEGNKTTVAIPRL